MCYDREQVADEESDEESDEEEEQAAAAVFTFVFCSYRLLPLRRFGPHYMSVAFP